MLKVVLNLDMNFLHEGYPKLKLKTKKPAYQIIKKNKLKKYSLVNKLHKILSSPNIVTKEFVANQYDHEVQGSSIIKPLQGVGKVFGNTTDIVYVLLSIFFLWEIRYYLSLIS